MKKHRSEKKKNDYLIWRRRRRRLGRKKEKKKGLDSKKKLALRIFFSENKSNQTVTRWRCVVLQVFVVCFFAIKSFLWCREGGG